MQEQIFTDAALKTYETHNCELDGLWSKNAYMYLYAMLGLELVETFAAEMPDLCLRCLLGFGEFDFAAVSTADSNQFGFDSLDIAELPDLCLPLLGFGEFDFAAVSTSASNQLGFDSFDIAATEGIAVAVAIAETAGTVVPVPPYSAEIASAEIASAALVLAATV